MFQWDAKYETGEENIDRQHKLLFSHIDTLERALDEGNVATRLPNILNYLKIFVNLHFSYEEQCMFLCQCPVAEENKAAHQTFQEAISRLDERMQREGPNDSLAREMHDFLKRWLAGHICKIDLQIKPCLRHD